MRTIMGCAIVVVLVAVASADEKVEKIDAKLLIGKWKGAMEGQGSMEFTKDGKYKMTNVKGEVTDEGTYKVEENKVTIGDVVRHDLTVSKLTETELVVTDIFNGPKKPQRFNRDKWAETPAINLWVDLGLGLIGEEEAKEKMKSLDSDFKSTLKSETEAMTGDLYGVRHVSGKQFAALVDKIDLVSSFSKTTVIGKTQERGYLEVKIALTSSHGYVAIVCAPLDDLPESTRKKL